jgi:CelD/BcsL family acetyltransferase involved in cellulose biosynthesis
VTVTMTSPLSVTIRLQTFTSFDDAQLLEPEWDALVTRLGGSLYSTFSWCQVWWRHYGGGRELRVIAVRLGEELVGVLPLFVDSLRLPLPIGRARVAKLVGSDFTTAVIDPLVQTDVAVEAFTSAMRQIFDDDGADMVHLACSGSIPHLDAIRHSATAITDVAQVIRDQECDSHTIFEMPDGFDAYMRSLSSHQRSNYRRKIKKLSVAFNVDTDVVRDESLLVEEFDAFVNMHQAQWAAINRLGHFGDWPASREFSTDLVRTLAQTDRVRLVRLLADGEVVAYYWCFALNSTYYWRLSARLYGDKWDQFALGRVGVVKMMEVADREGVTATEAGVGSYGYKENLNAKTFPVYSVGLCRRGLASQLRARLTLVYGDILNLCYYRIWYLRIAPRVRILRRPLSQSWIRRRF